jgi:tetratricopeptide (TPR) repeat protein
VEQAEVAYLRCMGLSTATSGELAQCCSHLGTLAIAKGSLTEAEKYFRDALRLNRNLSTAMFGLAQVLAITGQLNLAIRYMVACIDSSKGKGDLRYKAMALMDQWRQMKEGMAHARDGPET